ncbi:MAG: magnesium transporter [Gammaproteobacteria bacterium]
MESANNKEFRLQALRTALESGTMRGIHRMINSLHPAEIATLLESLPPARREVVWELVDPEDEGEVLIELNDEVRANLISGMDSEELVAAMEGMELDDLADIMGDLPEAVNRQVLRSLEHQDRDRLRAVLAYPEDTAGGLMNTDAVTVRPDVVLEVVLRYLRARGGVPERTDQLFVVNRNDAYLGSLAISRLLTQDPQRTVAELMDTGVEPISADLPEAEVARLFEDRDLLSAAVVDDTGTLVGRITIDDVVDVIREQGEHSIMRMAGLDEDEDMFAPAVKSARRRAVWLGVNVATAFLAAWVVGLFQATIDQVVVLAVLMPIVASMGGIAGSQTLTLVIRGIALGQIERSNARWLIQKEIAIGLLNGFGMALIVAAAVVIWFRSWQIGGVIAAALVINLLVAALAGVGIPLVLKRLKIDPALAGSVVLIMMTDAIGFLAFLGLGSLFLT